MNVKVVERLYHEERLALRRRLRKKILKGVCETILYRPCTGHNFRLILKWIKALLFEIWVMAIFKRAAGLA